MIELNLLPDIKLEYIKAQRIKRLLISISIITSVAAISLLVLLLLVETWQKHTLSNLNNEVATKTQQLKHKPHINDVLTVQNQLSTLNSLHQSEPVATKVFEYLNDLTPNSVTISSLSIDFNAHTIDLKGNAVNVSNINQFIDTLNFTTYSLQKGDKGFPAFNTIAIVNESQDTTQADTTNPAAFSVTANYDPTLFDVTKNVTLTIPNKVTTRPSLENPGPLFIHSNNTANNTGSGN